MQRNKKQEEVVWGQRWLPVCLWHMSQLALTVNAGKTTFPKAGQRRWGWKKAVGWLLKRHACAALGMGRRGRWSFIGLEPLRPE